MANRYHTDDLRLACFSRIKCCALSNAAARNDSLHSWLVCLSRKTRGQQSPARCTKQRYRCIHLHHQRESVNHISLLHAPCYIQEVYVDGEHLHSALRCSTGSRAKDRLRYFQSVQTELHTRCFITQTRSPG
ncbi:hypothetical protein B0T13DRAFT_74706 [Neurospora crassa]|nr:hypothetical protein B0T13DRAFT_74706 [Neurospora crassa]